MTATILTAPAPPAKHWPAAQTEWRSLHALIPYARNARLRGDLEIGATP
jgi:hypothetical protein